MIWHGSQNALQVKPGMTGRVLLELLKVRVANACACRRGGVLRAKPDPGSKLFNTQREPRIFSATPHTRNGGPSR